MCHREFGVDLNGALVKGQGGGTTSSEVDLLGRTICFQGFQRRRRRLGQRSVVPGNRGQRFTDSGSELAGHLPQDIQYIFFSRCLHLLLIEDVSRATALGAQPQYVLAAETCNRPFQDGRTGGSLADFSSTLRSKPRVRWLTHQTQRLLDTFVGDEAEERRLFKLHCQPLAKRPVK